MRTFASRALAALTLSGFLVGIGAWSGCGPDNSTSDAPLDPEAKKIDSGVQGGMKEFMQSKQQPKGKSK
jgi:hypothetical protein